MWDAVLCILIIGGFFILRAILATVFFFYLLPQGDRCPNCDAVTLRIQSRAWNVLFPRFRTSWCYECGWHGLLRRRPAQRADRDWRTDSTSRAEESAAAPPAGEATPASCRSIRRSRRSSGARLARARDHVSERVVAVAVDRPDRRRGSPSTRNSSGVRPSRSSSVDASQIPLGLVRDAGRMRIEGAPCWIESAMGEAGCPRARSTRIARADSRI